MAKHLRIILLSLFLLITEAGQLYAQSYNFNSGPIPMCSTSTFTANVSGVGPLINPNWGGWGFFLNNLCINITSNHPQTLLITLTSPQGTNLLLSAYNGAGGSNYTNTCFNYFGSIPITSGTAPFTGWNWAPQGGSFSIFDWEWGDGIWTISITDTACTGGNGPGGPWTPGFFNGGGAGGGISFMNTSPPCWGGIPDNNVIVCQGTPVDILSFYTNYDPWLFYSITLNGNVVANPSAVTSPGTYNIIGSDSWGCVYYAYYTITYALGPDKTSSTCPGKAVNLTALFPLSGFTASWTLNGSPITTAQASAATQPGVYQVIANNSAGCIDTAIVTLSVIPAFSLGPDQTITNCSNASINLTTLYNTSGLVPSWTFNGSVVSNPSAVTANGVYTLVASNFNGCRDTALVTLNQNSAPNLGPDQSVSYCSGFGVDLTSLFTPINYTANWSLSGVPVSNPTLVSAPGNYMLIATNAAGCKDTAIAILNAVASPALGPDQALTICSNSTLDLSTLYTTSGLSAQWSNNGMPVSNPVVNTAGVYTLIATNSNGCGDTALVTLNVNPTPSPGPDVSLNICTNQTTDLNSHFSTAGYIATWTLNGNPVSNPASVSTTGNYLLTATSASGCSATAQLILTNTPAPVLGLDQSTSICPGTSIDLNSFYNTAGFTANWTLAGVPVLNPASVIAAGTYQLIATAANGCTDTAVLTVNFLPAVSLGPDQTLTICSNSTADLTTLYATSGLSTQWSYSGIPVSNPVVNTPGVYTLIATNSNGCSATATVTLNVNQVPVPGPDVSLNICSNENTNLNAHFNTAGYTTSWTMNSIPLSNPNSVSTPGTYLLTATSAPGCSATAQLVVATMPAPSLGPDQITSICPGSSIDLNSFYNTAGFAADWTLAGVPVMNPASVNTPGIYQLIATASNGCVDTALLTLNIAATPVLAGNQNISVCSNSTVDLTAYYNTTGLSSAWTYNGQPVAQPQQINTAGSYVLTVTNSSGCEASSTITVSLDPAPNLGSDQVMSICNGNTVDLTSLYLQGGNIFTWSFAGNPVSNPSTVSSPGNYQLIAVNNFGCSDTANVLVNVFPLPQIGTGATYDLCPWMSIDLSTVYNLSGLNASYYLNGNPVANYTSVHDSGTYLIVVTDNNGCSLSSTVEISEIECLCAAEINVKGNCLEDLISFSVKADSLIISAHWDFGTSSIQDQSGSDLSVKFTEVGTYSITLNAVLGCGSVIVEKDIHIKECYNTCPVYLPNSFTPNKDGINDTFGCITSCIPEEFEMNIFDRYGALVFHSVDPAIKWNGKQDKTEYPIGLYVVKVDYKMPDQTKKQILTRIQMIK